jgi:hypothetical protein
MIKRHSSLLVKLFVNHIAIAVFGLMMTITTKFMAKRNMNGNLALYYILGVVAVLLYVGILYVNFWELGASDKIKIEGGRLKKNIFTGLIVSAVANIPSFILGILAMISCYVESGFLAMSGVIFHFYNGMYLFVLENGNVFPPIYLIVLLPALITSFVSYILGVKGFKCLFPEPKKTQENRTK